MDYGIETFAASEFGRIAGQAELLALLEDRSSHLSGARLLAARAAALVATLEENAEGGIGNAEEESSDRFFRQ